MARRKRTIQNILAQRDRAIKSLYEREKRPVTIDGEQSRIKYRTSQLRAYQGAYTPVSKGKIADRNLSKREAQIEIAADNAIQRLQKQGQAQRAARKAQGLSVG